MSYKLYTDKQEIFECKIHLEGASLSKATARILIESDNVDLMFKGSVDKNGNCKVPIKKLKGLLDESDKGRIKLEVIAEDIYFEPWKSDFEIETSKKIKVEVKEQKQPKTKKPRIVVTEVKNKKPRKVNLLENVVKSLKNKGITINHIRENKERFATVLNEFAGKAGHNDKNSKIQFIRRVLHKLASK